MRFLYRQRAKVRACRRLWRLLAIRSVPFGAAGDYDTKERPMLLKETKLSERRALFLYDALSEIERCGNVKVDTPVFTKEGELRAASREGAFIC